MSDQSSPEQMKVYVPSGFLAGHYGVCERLEVHGVCWLEGDIVSDVNQYFGNSSAYSPFLKSIRSMRMTIPQHACPIRQLPKTLIGGAVTVFQPHWTQHGACDVSG
jgi:hypothetical protein